LTIKLFDPHFDEGERTALIDVLQSGNWASGAGTGKVKEFEDEFQEYLGADECIALNSGSAALHLALLQFNLKNREVLVPSLTFVSTVHAIKYAGGSPVFVDINQETMCVDINDLKRKISKKSSLIIPVHFGGLSCNLEEIVNLSLENNIPIVEDAAHACGTSYQGKKIGTHSEMVCFSFHPVKNLSMPTGGVIAINGKTANVRKKIINSQRWCGIDNRSGGLYDVPRIGWNYYLNEFSAAIGIQQLRKLDMMNKRRKTIAKMYHSGILLENKIPMSEYCCYHLFWIRVKDRINFIKFMNESDIEVGIHYKPVHLLTMYNKRVSLPNTEMVWQELVSLPMHANLTDNDVSFVIEKINQFHKLG